MAYTMWCSSLLASITCSLVCWSMLSHSFYGWQSDHWTRDFIASLSTMPHISTGAVSSYYLRILPWLLIFYFSDRACLYTWMVVFFNHHHLYRWRNMEQAWNWICHCCLQSLLWSGLGLCTLHVWSRSHSWSNTLEKQSNRKFSIVLFSLFRMLKLSWKSHWSGPQWLDGQLNLERVSFWSGTGKKIKLTWRSNSTAFPIFLILSGWGKA